MLKQSLKVITLGVKTIFKLLLLKLNVFLAAASSGKGRGSPELFTALDPVLLREAKLQR